MQEQRRDTVKLDAFFRLEKNKIGIPIRKRNDCVTKEVVVMFSCEWHRVGKHANHRKVQELWFDEDGTLRDVIDNFITEKEIN